MALIELQELGQYGENVASTLLPASPQSTRKIRRRLHARLHAVKRITEEISRYHPVSGRLPKEFEWLCDNRYLAEREGRGAILLLKAAGRLPGHRKGYPRIFGLAEALVRSGNGAIRPDRVEAFLTGAQKAGAFSEKELWLFIVMLKVSLIYALHDLALRFTPMAEEYAGTRKGVFSAELELERIRAEHGSVSAETEQAAREAETLHGDYTVLAENIFSSLRLLSSTDFRDLLHRLSSVESILSRDPAGIYPSMDEESRSQYRRIVSRLALKQKSSETAIAEQALSLASAARDAHSRHVGYYLLTCPLGKKKSNRYGVLYFLSLTLVTVLLILVVLPLAGPLSALLLLIPVSDVAKNLCDAMALKLRHPVRLPRMELPGGIPDDAKTLCILSVLLTGNESGAQFAGCLERYRLANRNAGSNLLFGILADLKDAMTETTAQDQEILDGAKAAIRQLNQKYGGGFYLFTRSRSLSVSDCRYYARERKRGALIALTRLLRGKPSELRCEPGNTAQLKNIRYVITLDADTRLTIGSAAELVGTMLHPLNRPVIDKKRRIVTEGHALLQPRISVDLDAASRSFFSRAFGGLGGTDPYGSTISDLYQDLFDEGSFTGKGIFEAAAFSVCLDGRFPDNRILSHDLLEGCYLRSGLVSDVELTDGFPYKVGSYFSRLHRWTRGDWQLLPWLQRKVPGPGGKKEQNPLSRLSKWKILDNLRRSLVPVLSFSSILAGMFRGGLFAATGVAILIILSNLALSAAAAFLRGGAEIGNRFHSSILYGVRASAAQTLLSLMFLPHQAMVVLHAILTALYRMWISKRNLLQWVTAEQSDQQVANSIPGMYRTMILSPIWGLIAILFSDHVLSMILGVLWILAPLAASLISRPSGDETPLSEDDRAFLRRQSALMWQYFETFMDESNHYLPPDNWQEQPAVGVARRTSPTNIGLALLCCLSAYDLRLIGLTRALEKIDSLLSTVEKLQKWRGHPLNWYDTATLKPLYPMSVSSVDSGNLAACYIALAEGLSDIPSETAAALAKRARVLLDAMDFRPLYDPSRKLFYISLDAETEQPSEGWYDLLASEARQTSYLCIARGVIDRKHWRRLGRALVRKNGYAGMASWTGTMFEYLMPNLLLPAYRNSLIYESLRFCVYCQKLRSAAFRIPWGISESAYFAFDRALNYQYKAHGVQRLAFKRGLNRELVVSPYSTFLALEVEPAAAIKNLRRLQAIGLEGRFGLCEAADYTPSRLFSGLPFESVRCFMAHHVGMSLIACDNALNDRVMQRRFMADAEMAAYAELLQERTPVDAVTVHASFSEVPEKPKRTTESEWSQAHVGYDAFQPRCHLLSNGSYALFLTDTGLSYSVADGLLLTRFDGELTGGVSGISFWIRTETRILPLTPAPFFEADVQYSSEFDERSAKLYAAFDGLKTSLTACVAVRDKAELREVKIKTDGAFTGELLCYFEPILAKPEDHASHPAFSKLFLEAEADTSGVLICRRDRSGEGRQYAAFLCSERDVRFSTSREKALGRGGAANLRRVSVRQLSFTGGSVLDPCLLAGVPLRLQEGETKTIRFALSAAGNMDSALSAAERTLSLPFRQASGRPAAEARSLSLTHPEVTSAFEFLRELTFLTPGRRHFAKSILQNQSGQSGLWKYGISGDLPILSAICTGETPPEQTARLIRQHALLTLGGIRSELVLLLSDGDDYRRPIRTAAQDLIRVIGAENRIGAPGGIFLLDIVESDPDYALIVACSSVLIRPGGELVGVAAPALRRVKPPERLTASHSSAQGRNLRYGADGSVRFDTGGVLPANAWSNVLANPAFGYIATDSGSGYMWNLNARENRINNWTNDTLALDGDERIALLFGEKSVSVFASDDRFPCTVTYGPGYAVWEKQLETGTVRTTAFVHHKLPCRLMKVEYTGAEAPVLSWLTGLVLGDRPSMRRHVITYEKEGTIYAINRYNTSFAEQTILFASEPACNAFTCDRFEAAAGVYVGSCGAGYDPCVAMRIPLKEGSAVLLTAADRDGDGTDMKRYRDLLQAGAFDHALAACKQYWAAELTPVMIETPSPELDRYINGWALCQTIVCRLYARTSMYQSGGAFGFRDQLQDACAALLSDPELTKRQILLAAAHQFREGDVQHWWHPHDLRNEPEKGVRTRCSDDLLWLPYAVYEYIEKTGDAAILDAVQPYLTSELLDEQEHERYETPQRADEASDLYEHCLRAISMAMQRGEGPHGLSLIGSGDWNDGFNRVGEKGSGESVWLTWFFSVVLRRFAAICERRGDEKRADTFRAYAGKLLVAAEKAWDGEWYCRGFYDSGAPLGSHKSDECSIDSIAQSFSALAGGDRERSVKAVRSARSLLADRDAQLVRLFTPPFQNSRENPGYIKGYLKGVRENGGQYTHAAVWLAMGCIELGLRDEGYEILHMLLPSLHPEEVYRLEPYVLAADVYTAEGHVGRGGWSWYTGSSSWYYRAAVESLLGIRLRARQLVLKPQLPSGWPGYRAQVRFLGSEWTIEVTRGEEPALYVDGERTDGVRTGDIRADSARTDGVTTDSPGSDSEVCIPEGRHQVRLVLPPAAQ